LPPLGDVALNARVERLMSDSKSWRRSPDGWIEFRDSRSFLRTVFGAVMALFGAFFLTAMIVGLFRPGGWEAAMVRPGNTLGVMAFALFFFVVGWLVVVHCTRIVLDSATREVAVMHDLFPFEHKRILRLDDFRAAVMTTRRTDATGKSRSELVYSVRLVKADRKSELVASMHSVTDANKLGLELAGMLGSELIEMPESQWDKFYA